MSKLPLVKGPDEELALRKIYKGDYNYEGPDPFTGEIYTQKRKTRLEYPDPVPVEIPIYLQRPESTDERIMRLMSAQRDWLAYQQREDESEDDEMDFDPDDSDPDLPPSPYEFTALAASNIKRNKQLREYKERRSKKLQDASKTSDPSDPVDKKQPTTDKADAKSPTDQPPA